jgi:hypothetical protein
MDFLAPEFLLLLPIVPSLVLLYLWLLRRQKKQALRYASLAIDTLTLARNARTSPEMIDRFYAAPLQGEMNVALLQSKSRPRPWELHRGL